MKLASIILSLAVLILPISVFAQRGEAEVLQSTVTAEERKQAAKEFRDQLIADKKQELTDARAQRIVERCERLQTKVGQVAERLNTIRDARGNLVSNLVTRLEAFSESLAAANGDTTALNEDITTLKTMSDELNVLWQAYIDEVNTLKDASCADGADPFHEALEAAKAAMADVQAKFKEVKDFLQSDVKPELQHIREDLAGEQAE